MAETEGRRGDCPGPRVFVSRDLPELECHAPSLDSWSLAAETGHVVDLALGNGR